MKMSRLQQLMKKKPCYLKIARLLFVPEMGWLFAVNVCARAVLSSVQAGGRRYTYNADHSWVAVW
jgi:hypothetical protein